MFSSSPSRRACNHAPDVGGSRAGLRAQFRAFGSTSQWNVIEGAIMASLQYQDPDIYEEVQVAGASKGADAPVGGSVNNFIVKSGGNNLRGLFFYDREPLDLQSSNFSDDLKRQGVTNTSSVARYQSVHGDMGGPFMRDKFSWFYGFRNLNSDNWAPGYYNTQTGQPEPVFTTLRNHAMKLNYRVNPNNSSATRRNTTASRFRTLARRRSRTPPRPPSPTSRTGFRARRGSPCSRTDRRST